MTATIGTITGTDTAEAAGAAAWRAMKASADLQFVPIVDPAPQPPPAWLVAIGRFFGTVFGWIGHAIDWALGWLVTPIAHFFGMNARMIEIALIVMAGTGLLWAVWTLLWPRWKARRTNSPAATAWAPDTNAALALLEDADALAAAGRFDEAARLLLHRSVGEIAASRPAWLAPSSTAREIGANPRLPWRARAAFMVIAREVERSLFALTGLMREDWERARAAYAEFALAEKSSEAR